MDRSEHIRCMRETGEVVIPIIEAAYSRCADSDSRLADAMSLFVSRRTTASQPLLRPYLVRLAYEVCGGRDWKEVARACAASEIFNISTYQANVAFDGKLTVSSQEERAEQFGCAMISMGLAALEVGLLNAGEAVRTRIQCDLQRVNTQLYHGQLTDLRGLNLASIERITEFEALYDRYRQRCLKLGGELTRWCMTTGAILAGADQSFVDVLAGIGARMGIAGQMVNDIGDLVPVHQSAIPAQSLRYQPAFSDILNGKITYPILFAFQLGDGEACRLALSIWREQIKHADVHIRLTQRLRKIGAFDAAKRVIRDLAKETRIMVRSLRKSAARDRLLLCTTSLTHNKYFTVLRLADPVDHSTGNGNHRRLQ